MTMLDLLLSSKQVIVIKESCYLSVQDTYKSPLIINIFTVDERTTLIFLYLTKSNYTVKRICSLTRLVTNTHTQRKPFVKAIFFPSFIFDITTAVNVSVIIEK